MVYKIKLRRGTAAAWTSTNPVLLDGEPGFESDTGRYKLGDGASAWTALPYYGAHPNLAAHDAMGLATDAELAAAQASVVQRANHTGTQTSATISDFTEAVQDAVNALLGAGSNVTLTYNDAANTLTVAATGGGTTDLEAVRDAIGIALVGAGLISVAVNDALDTITLSTTATQNATDANLRDRATHTGAQAISTVTGLQAALDGKADDAEITALDGRLDTIEAQAKVLVLNSGAAVPGGTPAGTVILRRAP